MTVLQLITGLLLAFNLPSNLPWWIIVIGALAAIGVGKLSFGGLGNNPFQSALVGRVFLMISFPVQMTSWPEPVVSRLHYTDAVTGATPLAILKDGLSSGIPGDSVAGKGARIHGTFHRPPSLQYGEISALALLAGGIYMLIRKIITWHIPVSILLTVAVPYRDTLDDQPL
jgi:Na+-translocating ferredoxin:NAD+ oxidoreductase subunit D